MRNNTGERKSAIYNTFCSHDGTSHHVTNDISSWIKGTGHSLNILLCPPLDSQSNYKVHFYYNDTVWNQHPLTHKSIFYILTENRTFIFIQSKLIIKYWVHGTCHIINYQCSYYKMCSNIILSNGKVDISCQNVN